MADKPEDATAKPTNRRSRLAACLGLQILLQLKMLSLPVPRILSTTIKAWCVVQRCFRLLPSLVVQLCLWVIAVKPR